MLDTVTAPRTQTAPVVETADALILGTGFAGLCAAIRLQQAGGRSFIILEKSHDVGGTWRDNVYPGCACDVPSHLYSLSFAPKSDWTRMYATQPEIWSYLQDVARKFGLHDRIRFGATVVSAVWDEARTVWRVTAKDGRIFEARMVFSGLGPLHIPAYPNIPGREIFTGSAFHSAEWDFSTELAGKRVAVIGTGASAIQFIPQIAGLPDKLTVFQRTPAWIMPKLDYEFSEAQQRRLKHPLYRQLFRFRIFVTNELRALGFLGNKRVAIAGEGMARAHLAKQIKDPALRSKLSPDYRMGCKRVLISNDFYPAMARDNVALETGGIAEIRANSVVTPDGREIPTDVIIYGTGFHTTDSFASVKIVGRNGLDLNDAFADGMHAHFGITVPGFPNFFFLLGPNTGLGHNSVVLMIEAQVNYVMSLLKQMDAKRWRTADVRPDTEQAWNDKIQTKLQSTVWTQGGCKSWYMDENGRNTTVWPGLVYQYQLQTRKADIGDYVKVEAA
jgi:cation diffusion facilitator CzcD-associated flavoprotein CzcO